LSQPEEQLAAVIEIDMTIDMEDEAEEDDMISKF
jgi:hypothetical protein